MPIEKEVSLTFSSKSFATFTFHNHERNIPRMKDDAVVGRREDPGEVAQTESMEEVVLETPAEEITEEELPTSLALGMMRDLEEELGTVLRRIELTDEEVPSRFMMSFEALFGFEAESREGDEETGRQETRLTPGVEDESFTVDDEVVVEEWSLMLLDSSEEEKLNPGEERGNICVPSEAGKGVSTFFKEQQTQ